MVDDPTRPHLYVPNQPPPLAGQQPLSPSDERTWSIVAHIGSIVFSFLAPLVVWLVFRDRSRWVALHAKEALNFQILATIVYALSGVLTHFFIGAVSGPLMWILSLIFSILAAVAANSGHYKPYPLNIRFVR